MAQRNRVSEFRKWPGFGRVGTLEKRRFRKRKKRKNNTVRTRVIGDWSTGQRFSIGHFVTADRGCRHVSYNTRTGDRKSRETRPFRRTVRARSIVSLNILLYRVIYYNTVLWHWFFSSRFSELKKINSIISIIRNFDRIFGDIIETSSHCSVVLRREFFFFFKRNVCIRAFQTYHNRNVRREMTDGDDADET